MRNDQFKNILKENGVISPSPLFAEKLATTVVNSCPPAAKKAPRLTLGTFTVFALVALNIIVLCVLGATQLNLVVFITLLLFCTSILLAGWFCTKLLKRNINEALVNT
ncbi:hypothetical protein SAMN05660909_02114 [Chitinophaga terrae (ex Kim and Jung 2007)]|uniref:Uncharacterized protein n=1 Tax=Chitinophaga terrae (ex Kim and Jung 2007) TaxID=408074 RepID=A0A1H4BJQ7_9BACT|nr:hypothetical protein [Chitinophaga terrae (ex Kim and Jung 2007)]GEP89606.1 hypothetical protein CTE07_12510 [Chitinophaga terrae (ex Kim and Jung 2007)]SEA48403.1 hypothetical protein SAMN05660909_02114 [Chitinophaga terrae (ex Kim and Jung 2007)]